MSSNPWNLSGQQVRHCVHIRAQSDSLGSAAGANALVHELLAANAVIPAGALQPLISAYMVSSAERMRAIQGRLGLSLHVTEARIETELT